eukprot:1140227-Pelagomonas_calceolata.AAC.1
MLQGCTLVHAQDLNKLTYAETTVLYAWALPGLADLVQPLQMRTNMHTKRQAVEVWMKVMRTRTHIKKESKFTFVVLEELVVTRVRTYTHTHTHTHTTHTHTHMYTLTNNPHSSQPALSSLDSQLLSAPVHVHYFRQPSAQLAHSCRADQINLAWIAR